MKKIIYLPFLFLTIITQAQFNTASFNPKIQNISLAVSEFEHSKKSFLNYENITATDEEKTTPSQKKEQIAYKKVATIDFREIEERQLIYMPLSEMIISSGFGTRYHPIDKVYKEHNGIDLAANNSFVFSVLDGIVVDSGYSRANGNYIIIRHEDFETYYLHLDSFYNIVDDIISAGDIIGVTGSTGKSTGEHLHFAVKENGKFINPVTFLNNLIKTNNTILDYDRN